MESLVQTRIQKPKWRLPSRDQRIVHQREDTSSRGARGTRPVQHLEDAPPDRCKMLALCRDIGIATSCRVIKPVVSRSQAGDVSWHNGVLVFGAREVVGKPTAAGISVVRIESCDLGLDVLGRTHGCHVGTGTGEAGDESGRFFAVVGDAVSWVADTAVATCAEKGDTSSAELGELVADGAGVGFWYGVFVVAVAGADDLWDVLLR